MLPFRRREDHDRNVLVWRFFCPFGIANEQLRSLNGVAGAENGAIPLFSDDRVSSPAFGQIKAKAVLRVAIVDFNALNDPRLRGGRSRSLSRNGLRAGAGRVNRGAGRQKQKNLAESHLRLPSISIAAKREPVG